MFDGRKVVAVNYTLTADFDPCNTLESSEPVVVLQETNTLEVSKSVFSFQDSSKVVYSAKSGQSGSLTLYITSGNGRTEVLLDKNGFHNKPLLEVTGFVDLDDKFFFRTAT